MFNLEKLHLPFRDETAFSLLAFCVFLVPISLSIISYENFESIKFSILLFFTGLASIIWLWKNKEKVIKLNVNKLVLSLVVAQSLFFLLSCILAEDRLYSFFGFYYRFTSGLLFYIAVLIFAVLCFVLVNKEKFIYLLKILTFDALLVSIVTILQSFRIIFYAGLDTGGFYRGPSLLGNPNYSSMFLATILPLVVYLFIISKTTKAKIYYSIVSLGIVISVVILASRGALLALLIALIAGFGLVAFSKIEKKLLIKLGILFGVVIIFSIVSFNYLRPNSISTITKGQDANTQSRLFAWKVSGIAIRNNPIFGVGAGNYALFFEKHRTNEIVGNIGVFDDAHNLYLHFIVNSGVPFALIFVILTILFYFYGIRSYLKHSNNLSLALVLSLLIWTVSVAFNPVSIPMYLLLVLIFLGISLNTDYFIDINLNKIVKTVIICLSVLMVILGTLFFISENILGLTRNYYSQNDYRKAYNFAKTSILLNPTNNLARIYLVSSQIYLNYSEVQIQAEIKKIINTHPLQSGSFVSAADLYYLLYTHKLKPEYLNQAILNMEQALYIDPLFSERYGQLGLFYYQRGNYNKSRMNVEKSLKLESKLFPSWVLLAKLDQLENNREKVIFNLEKALEINPDLPQLKYLIYVAKESVDVKNVPLDIFVKTPGI